MLEELGVEGIALMLLIDASAAKGLAGRIGTWSVRHIEVTQLWLQDNVSRGAIKVRKIAGGENRADAMTKHVGREELVKHIEGAGMKVMHGRSEAAPCLVGSVGRESGIVGTRRCHRRQRRNQALQHQNQWQQGHLRQ